MLTPKDIHEKEFGHGLRGYNADEVDDFLDQVVSDYGELFREIDNLRGEVAKLSQDNENMHSREQGISTALVLSQKAAEETTAKAEAEAAEILRNATEEADALRAKTDSDCKAYRDKINAALENAKKETDAAERNLEEIHKRAQQFAKTKKEEALTQQKEIISKAKETAEQAIKAAEDVRREADRYLESKRAEADNACREAEEYVEAKHNEADTYKAEQKKKVDKEIAEYLDSKMTDADREAERRSQELREAVERLTSEMDGLMQRRKELLQEMRENLEKGIGFVEQEFGKYTNTDASNG